MWKRYINNPHGRSVGDCAIRAVSVACNLDWGSAYALLCAKGYAYGDLPNADFIWGAVLRDRGFLRQGISSKCPDCYTVEDFCASHPTGIFVLGCGGHVVTAVDGDYYDSWDSGKEIPQFYWTKGGND